MKYSLQIDCGNDAFVAQGEPREVARILREEADRLDQLGRVAAHNAERKLRDLNGNPVGCAKFTGKIK